MRIASRNKTNSIVPPTLNPTTGSKKKAILNAWNTGEKNLWLLAKKFQTTPSYVASVLQAVGLISGYHDLFNSPLEPENIYAEGFRNRLGFKNVDFAKKSIEFLEKSYTDLSRLEDRAGQHHCLVTALTFFNRARFCGKNEEADIFKKWLLEKLSGDEAYSVTSH